MSICTQRALRIGILDPVLATGFASRSFDSLPFR